jgi:hypothetical protein
MVDRDDEHVMCIVEPEQPGPEDRASFQIEGPADRR